MARGPVPPKKKPTRPVVGQTYENGKWRLPDGRVVATGKYEDSRPVPTRAMYAKKGKKK